MTKVDGIGIFMKFAMKLFGTSSHSKVYQNILNSLKNHCESALMMIKYRLLHVTNAY